MTTDPRPAVIREDEELRFIRPLASPDVHAVRGDNGRYQTDGTILRSVHAALAESDDAELVP